MKKRLSLTDLNVRSFITENNMKNVYGGTDNDLSMYGCVTIDTDNEKSDCTVSMCGPSSDYPTINEQPTGTLCIN